LRVKALERADKPLAARRAATDGSPNLFASNHAVSLNRGDGGVSTTIGTSVLVVRAGWNDEH